jgi:hypothetical protein
MIFLVNLKKKISYRTGELIYRRKYENGIPS